MNSVSSVVRVMQQGDVERIQEIYLLAHVDEYAGEVTDFPPQGVSDNPALLELFHLSDIFVHDDGEAIKGFVGSRNNRVIWLYVDPEFRGQKIGQQLIDFMLSQLTGTVGISVIKSNRIALGLYQRRGFKVIGDFVFDYQGVPVDVYSMQRVSALQQAS